MSTPDDPRLAGKVAIVTGAGAADDGIGNGRAATILLARAGARVLAVDLDIGLAERTAAMAADEPGEVVAHAADVTDEAACAAMAAEAVARFGRLDLLDNNVGIGSSGTVVVEQAETWERVMRVNVESMFLAAKHAIPAMIDSGDGGAIVNVSSISALRPRGLTAYSASKGAVISLTRAMAIDHAGDGIRVNCVAPGPVYTPMVYGRGMSEEMREKRRKASPLGIEGSGWDIANAVVFLLSARARYITGQTLVVDGGVTVASPKRGA
ncbi:MAG: SDR family oxidoreductase [Alphaproteobacteria bacterium]|jgi:NAD(P)-dependent dehydrogenase (short-subunit alcohol dehydrogenase family)|nr:SDR family oxidoreductase [Alphaproteobacteria bacterium]